MAKDNRYGDRTPGLKEKAIGLFNSIKQAPEKLLGRGVLREAGEAKKNRKQKIDEALRKSGA